MGIKTMYFLQNFDIEHIMIMKRDYAKN